MRSNKFEAFVTVAAIVLSLTACTPNPPEPEPEIQNTNDGYRWPKGYSRGGDDE